LQLLQLLLLQLLLVLLLLLLLLLDLLLLLVGELQRLLGRHAAHGRRGATLQHVHRQGAALLLLHLLLLLQLLLLAAVQRWPPRLPRRGWGGAVGRGAADARLRQLWPWLPADHLPALPAQVVAALMAHAAGNLEGRVGGEPGERRGRQGSGVGQRRQGCARRLQPPA
jgi:hypothetical protein